MGSGEICTDSDAVSSRSGFGDVVCLYCYTCVVSVCTLIVTNLCKPDDG